MKKTILFVLFFWAVGLFENVNAQQTSKENSTINFFLECYHCDFTFVRQELEFVSFVRDPKLADVHILSSSQRTGSGGEKFFLNFIGLNNLKGKDFEYEYTAEQSETEDEIRQGLLKLIKTGILQYYSISGMSDQLNIELEESENTVKLEELKDPWKLWIFRLGSGFDFSKEESQNEYAYDVELRIEKVTEKWKTRFEGEHEISEEKFYDDGEKILNRQVHTEAIAYYIRSLSPKWSTGIFGAYESATYRNIKNSTDWSTGVEYNIFPWDVSNRKVFTLNYKIGFQTFDYNEITIYDKLNEQLGYESIGINLELVQPWGSVEASLTGRHYFYDFSVNRLIFSSDLSIRISKQFSVYSEFLVRSSTISFIYQKEKPHVKMCC